MNDSRVFVCPHLHSFGAERAYPTSVAQLTLSMLRFEGENRGSLLPSIEGRRDFGT